jgi:hypothetical protein
LGVGFFAGKNLNNIALKIASGLVRLGILKEEEAF